MKNVVITRGYRTNSGTMGILKIDGVEHGPIFTLERPWANNVPEASCIPAGTYTCAPFSGNKYKNVYQVLNVPGRTFILFHPGNTISDSLGCILPGLAADSKDGEPRVLQSRKAMKFLKGLLNNEKFRLTII